ncbi:hypothetical protein H9Y04_22065 [Streptomyces sp. TRM66268-LWL]|uniref:Uncharacterized protein n=1 Tax=Streptomyces polyasparticus TaxID=2767826 RepID=A0ABR7SKW0_9ACTN|nr:hypothetical protein [Streptomyces polyasparticus]MBC9715242.1 hypothetical protein [Streptomyces polyasparticus]
MDEDQRSATWAIYLALHHLAAGTILAMPLDTRVTPDRMIAGDLDHALSILNQVGPTAAEIAPELVERVRRQLTGWETAGPDRLPELLTALEDLSELTGSSLPLPLPPGLI